MSTSVHEGYSMFKKVRGGGGGMHNWYDISSEPRDLSRVMHGNLNIFNRLRLDASMGTNDAE